MHTRFLFPHSICHWLWSYAPNVQHLERDRVWLIFSFYTLLKIYTGPIHGNRVRIFAWQLCSQFEKYLVKIHMNHYECIVHDTQHYSITSWVAYFLYSVYNAEDLHLSKQYCRKKGMKRLLDDYICTQSYGEPGITLYVLTYSTLILLQSTLTLLVINVLYKKDSFALSCILVYLMVRFIVLCLVTCHFRSLMITSQ